MHYSDPSVARAAAAVLALLPGCSSLPQAGRELRRHAAGRAASGQPTANGAIFHTGHDVPLFENTVAHRVGDVLTITLQEQTNASKSATTTTKKTTTEAMAAPTLLGVPLTIHGAQHPQQQSQ